MFKNKIYKIALVLSAFILTVACNNEDDATDYSTVKPSSTALSVSLDFPNNQTFVETDATHDFTVTLSKAQVVNVIVYLSQTGGTATNGEDFSMPASITIPAGQTSATGTIETFADDLLEDTETAVIKIATSLESNVNSISSETVTFNLQNVTADDLVIDLSWLNTTDVYYTDGKKYAAEDVADLKLILANTTIPYTTTYATVDNAAGFENYVFLGSYPDGEYHLLVNFYSAVEFNDPVRYTDLDISLEFNQVGTINSHIVTAPAALNTEYANCQTTAIAKITKSGTNFTIEDLGGIPNTDGPFDNTTYLGDYNVTTTVAGAGGFGSPQFEGAVTLVDNGNGTRSFQGDWNNFGSVRTWVIEFNDACGTTTLADRQSTGLACAGGPTILLGRSTAPGTFDIADDTTLVVKYQENQDSSCGGSPVESEITFTKI